MPRYKLTIEYDGTGYYGWQRQNDFKTIQGTIESAIKSFSGQEIELFAAGRTDAGVHAIGQIAHFDLDKEFPEWQITKAINFYLKDEGIVILDTKIVNESFHARFSAHRRAYCYKILNRSSRSALDAHRAWHVKEALDIEKMQQAANLLIGHHDFSSFRAAGCQASSAQITLDEVKIHQEGQLILINVKAKSFLYHMVRNIAGSLVEVGKGDITIEKLNGILESRNRQMACVTAPAHGLYFTSVKY